MLAYSDVLKKNFERKSGSLGSSLASLALGLTMIQRMACRFTKLWRKGFRDPEMFGHSCIFSWSTRQGKDKAHSRKPYRLLLYFHHSEENLTLAEAGFHLHAFGTFSWTVLMFGAVLLWTAQTVSSDRFLCKIPDVFSRISFRHQRQRVLNAGTSRNRESSARMLFTSQEGKNNKAKRETYNSRFPYSCLLTKSASLAGSSSLFESGYDMFSSSNSRLSALTSS